MNPDVVQAEKVSRDHIALNDALGRLMSNRDFKKVILEKYMDDHVKYLSSLLTGFNNEHDSKFVAQLAAINYLRMFFDEIESNATEGRSFISMINEHDEV